MQDIHTCTSMVISTQSETTIARTVVAPKGIMAVVMTASILSSTLIDIWNDSKMITPCMRHKYVCNNKL